MTYKCANGQVVFSQLTPGAAAGAAASCFLSCRSLTTADVSSTDFRSSLWPSSESPSSQRQRAPAKRWALMSILWEGRLSGSPGGRLNTVCSAWVRALCFRWEIRETLSCRAGLTQPVSEPFGNRDSGQSGQLPPFLGGQGETLVCVRELCPPKPVRETGCSGCASFVCKNWSPLSAEHEPPCGDSQSAGLYIFIPA